MTTISSLNGTQCSGSAARPGALGSAPAGNRLSAYAGDDATTRATDSVDISSRAREFNRTFAVNPPVRQDLVERVRSEIAAGGYVTDDKIDGAAAQIVEDLNVLG